MSGVRRGVCTFAVSNTSTKRMKNGNHGEYLTEELAGDVSVGVEDLKDGNEVEDEDDLVDVESNVHCAMHC